MKKVYLLLPAFLVGTAFAQQIVDGPAVNRTAKQEKAQFMHRNALNSGVRAPGDDIFTEDFNGSLGSWTVTGEGGVINGTPTTPANQIVLHDTDGPNGAYSSTTQVITSPSAANGFAMMDIDFLNGGGSAPNPASIQSVNAELVSPVYNLNGYGNVSVKFYHAYRFCCSFAGPKIFLDVTTNGFTNVTTYDLEYADAGVNITSGTRLHNVNITNAIQGNPATTQIRFRLGEAGNADNMSHYFWMIDDISIYESNQFRAELDTVNWSTDVANWGAFGGFQQIPAYAATSTNLEWSAWLDNTGGSNWTNARLHVDQNGSTFAQSTGEAINAGSMSSALHVASATMPGTAGTYTYTVYPTADQTMEFADTFNFDVTVNEVASAYMGITGGSYSNGGTNPTDDMSCADYTFNTITVTKSGWGGAYYGDMTEVAHALSIVFTDTSINAFAPMTLIIEVNGNQVASQAFTVDGANMGTAQVVNLTTPVQIAPGDEVFYWAEDQDGEIRVLGSGSDAYHVGFLHIYDATGYLGYLLDVPPMVSLHTVPGTVSVDENEKTSINTLAQNTPNPFDNNTMIRFNLAQAEMCSFEVVDVTGKVVKSIDLGSRGAGQHQIELNANEFNKGIYFYTLTAGDSRMTKKMVVTK